MITPDQSELLRTLQLDSFSYFVHQTNPANGLVRDKSREGWPASIAAIGLALAAYPVGVERGFMTREDAVRRTLATLRFFANAPHGPESDATGHKGFLRYRWHRYDEALIVYLLGLGSPTHPLPVESYRAWASTYKWKRLYDIEFLYAGPLFIHQLSHVWIDFRDIRDEFMRQHELDYFENSRRATLVQQQYAIRNPRGFAHYDACCWGITASDGPGPRTLLVDGVERVFYDYIARGVPFGPDDGTLAPWAVVASLPFAPEIVLPTIRNYERMQLKEAQEYGYKASFNPTFPVEPKQEYGWVSPYHFGINQGPIVTMIENYRSGFLWSLMRQCPYLVTGLRRAGFTGGWLE